MPFLADAPPAAAATTTNSPIPIAIIGISLRGPGDASDTESFWQMLLDARSARTEIPKDRYNVDGFYHPDPDRLASIQQRHGHFLKQDFKVFDAPFFGVTPKVSTYISYLPYPALYRVSLSIGNVRQIANCPPNHQRK